MRAALEERRPDLMLPRAAWRNPWVMHCTPWGDGTEAVLRYFARYVFRVAIAGRRIVGQKWLHNFGRCDGWNLCLTAGTVVPANQHM